jgi:hypothetical protein
MTVIGACLVAVLLVVAGLTVMSRNRARLNAEDQHPDRRSQQVRKQKRAQSRHDRRRR